MTIFSKEQYMGSALSWILFNVFVVVMIFADMLVFQKRDHEIEVKEALGWTAFWIVLSCLFGAGIYVWGGHNAHQKSLEFFTGYLIEKSLSVDNLFVFLMIFSYFKVPAKFQHRVLFYGILFAIIFRGVFIIVGTSLVARFTWLLYLFGAFLVYIALKMVFGRDTGFDAGKNPIVRFFGKFFPMDSTYETHNFFTKQEGKTRMTKLLLVLLVVEFADVVFATDSIPAIFAVTLDPFIVYTSNIFAILGLRALYFAIAGMMKMFHYFKFGVGTVLFYVGAKMLVGHFVEIPTIISLIVIVVILAISVVASVVRAGRVKEK
jgi:tellurite resistance protein TerC